MTDRQVDEFLDNYVGRMKKILLNEFHKRNISITEESVETSILEDVLIYNRFQDI